MELRIFPLSRTGTQQHTYVRLSQSDLPGIKGYRKKAEARTPYYYNSEHEETIGASVRNVSCVELRRRIRQPLLCTCNIESHLRSSDSITKPARGAFQNMISDLKR